MAGALIEVSDLVKTFDTFQAVDGISFTVERGEVLGFLGPNGAGKSTTMKMITGYLAPTAGTVSICGHNVLEDPISAQREIGYLPEGAPAYAEMSPLQFLDFIADVRGLTGAAKHSCTVCFTRALKLFPKGSSGGSVWPRRCCMTRRF